MSGVATRAAKVPDPMDEEALIAGLEAGDNRAFRLAIRCYGGAMLAAAKTVSAMHAEDAVQEAWIASMQAIKSFERRSSLKTWLISIAINQAYGYLRKNKMTVSLDGMDAGSDPSSLLFNAQGSWQSPVERWTDDTPEKLLEARVMRGCIDHHLASLPAGQRMALVLTDFNSLSIEAVCRQLDVKPNNYRVLLHRARLSLFKMLSHYESTGDC